MSCSENAHKNLSPLFNAGTPDSSWGPVLDRTALWITVALATGMLACGHGRTADPDARGTDDVVAFAPGQGAVHGYVDAIGKSAVGLPDASVRLKRLSDGFLTPVVVTNVHGAFIASSVPIGTYAICLSGTPGFSDTCSSASFLVSAGKIAYPPHAVFSPLRFVVYGRVRLQDNRDVRYESEQFGQEVNTFVKALTPSGALVAGPVRANGRGDYILRQLASGTSYRIVVQSDSTTIESPVVTGTGPTQKNFLLPNRRPAVAEVNALQAGKGVRHVAAGSIVRVEARASDPDGQALHYKWRAPHGGSCPATDAAAVDCTMPTTLGVQSIYVQVSDGAGQFAVGRVRVSVGPAVSLFTGKLITDGDVPVPGAEVKVNGASVTSNAGGAFSVSVAETNRYVLTIKKDGFQLISKVFLDERIGATYRLVKAEAQILDPKLDNTILVRAPKSPTGDQGSYKDVTVTIKANSIVDADGKPVTTPVTAYHSRFDHLFDRSERMPGDTGATNGSGQDVTLTSLGAIEMNLRGPAGEKYNLASGMPADLTFEIHSSQLASAPPTIGLWYYNEDSGLWEQDGTATLVGTAYVAQAKHFSAINVDLQKSNATCLKLVVDQTTLTVPFTIRLSVPGFPDRDRTVDANVTAIVRLPPNVPNTTIVVLDGSNNPIPNSLRTFSTGDILPDGTNLSLDAPFNVCITPPSPPVTLGLDLPQNPNPFWLTKLSNPGATDVQRNDYASAYYTAINAETMFDDWKNRNQFNLGDDATAYYFNAGDLEFGRAMHMKNRSDGGIAYYVTNFATADQAFGGAAGDVIATVAMEYSQYPSMAPGAPRFTKFYVFDKTGNRVNSAELDNRGDKYVPGLCVVCHGGTLPPNIAAATPPGNTDSRFIPFDLKSFQAAEPLHPGFPAMLPRAAQEDSFRKLNEGVYLHTGATTSQTAVIDAWYAPGGVSNPGQTQQDGIGNIPFFWNSLSGGGASLTDSQFYYDVIRPSCRACHTSRGPGLDFGDPASFQSLGGLVIPAICTSGQMPQSFVTWRNFWHSLAPKRQPTLVESYFSQAPGSCTGP